MEMKPSMALPENATVVASFIAYVDAQRAVDRLADADFPVEHVAIVGTDLRLVELVTGRLSWGRAAAMGIGGGAWFGLLVGLFFGIFSFDSSLSTAGLVLFAVVWGAVAGLVFGLASYALTGGQRDFLSRSQVIAGRYDVLVRGSHATRATELIGPHPR